MTENEIREVNDTRIPDHQSGPAFHDCAHPYAIGILDRPFPWRGIVRIVDRVSDLDEAVTYIRHFREAELLRVWLPESRHWATPYEVECLAAGACIGHRLVCGCMTCVDAKAKVAGAGRA